MKDTYLTASVSESTINSTLLGAAAIDLLPEDLEGAVPPLVFLAAAAEPDLSRRGGMIEMSSAKGRKKEARTRKKKG
jgi:hypothetical protein